MGRPRKQNGNLWRKLQKRIRTRDTHCHLCGQEINKTLPPGHPWSFEVDHIVSIANGGPEYDINNLAGSHRKCNLEKGAGNKKPLNGPLTVSQDWAT